MLESKELSSKFNIPFIFTSHSLGVFLEGYNNERTDCEKIVMTSSHFVTASTNYENILLSESYKIDKKKIPLMINLLKTIIGNKKLKIKV